MNLKIKSTLVWLLAISITILATAIIFASLQYPAIVLVTGIVAGILYVLVSAWVSIYHYLKSKEELK